MKSWLSLTESLFSARVAWWLSFSTMEPDPRKKSANSCWERRRYNESESQESHRLSVDTADCSGIGAHPLPAAFLHPVEDDVIVLLRTIAQCLHLRQHAELHHGDDIRWACSKHRNERWELQSWRRGTDIPGWIHCNAHCPGLGRHRSVQFQG